MERARAAIVRHAEQRGIGDAAAADRARRFQHHAFAAGGDDPPRRGDAGGAGSDDHDVDAGPRLVAGPFDFCWTAPNAGVAASAPAAARNDRRVSFDMASGVPGTMVPDIARS